MENFVFSSRAKTITGGAALIGLVCLIASAFVDGGEGHHMRFWTNLLHNSVFFLGIAFIAAFAYSAFTTAYAGWFVQFKRVWESFSLFLLPGLVLMLVIIVGLWMHWHHLYHWNDEAAVMSDPILTHKSSFLNKYWYTFGTIVFVGVWYFFVSRMRQLSLAEDSDGDSSYSHHKKIKVYAAIFLPIAGFTSAAMIWQWIMSIDSHWYSTMFAWYASASLFVAMTALTIMILIYLKSRGYYKGITAEHFHDLGKYLFAISIFWTYLWFSQYMLIWYGNVGEETIYFRQRLDSYPVLFWGNLLLNFVLPFFILMRNDTKRKFGTLFFASALVFFGHWFDYFQMIKPGARLTLVEMEAHHGDDHHGEEEHSMTLDAPAEHSTMSMTPQQGDHGEEGHGEETHGEEMHADEAHADDHADEAHHDDHGTEMTGHMEAAVEHGEDHGDGHGDEHSALGFKSGYTLPGLLEIGTFLGFLGGFLFFVFSRLSAAPLEPKKDPYMEESLHHHT